MPEFPSPTTFAIPLFILAVAWEWWAVRTGRVRGRYEVRDALVSMTMGVGNAVMGGLLGAVALAMMMLFWPHRLIGIPVTWWSFLVVFFLYDFAYYWKHRLAHRVRWFWAEHATHHSSTHYNLTTALRQPWVGPLSGLILLGGPLVILGFHPAFIGFAGGLNLVYQFWIHTEAVQRMPRWFEAILNTPSHHRVHHATNARYLDANYAGVFIIWDKLFGTFVPELDAEKPTYGIVKPLGSFNPLVIAFHEYAGLLRDFWRDGLKPWRWAGRLLNPPGWSPDGAHSRSEDIKRAYIESHPDQAGTPGLPARLARDAKGDLVARAPAA